MKTESSFADNSPAITPASRRSFIKHSTLAAAGAAVASNFPFVLTSHAAPDDPIRIGVIGCGGRGSGAVLDALGAETNVIYPKSGYHTEDIKAGTKLANKNISVVALADVFPDRIESCRGNLSKLGVSVPTEKCFTGFDAYQKLLAIPEINYVILATPPHFRPVHLKAAIAAGQKCVHRKALCRGRARRAHGDGSRQAREGKEPRHRLRHATAPSQVLQRNHQAHPGRRDRRTRPWLVPLERRRDLDDRSHAGR